mgnify:CR=1 FL=1|jgi:hypothetical protein
MIVSPVDRGVVYFTDQELRCPDTGEVRLDPRFADMLAKLRHRLNEPMDPTSACRSRYYNIEIGGHERSLHVWDHPTHDVEGTAAIDIAAPSLGYALRLVQTALGMGWSVGVGRGFIHLDRRDLAGLEPGLFGY